MKTKTFLIGFCVMLLILCAGTVSAQYRQSIPESTFFPYKNPPPLSPWLELERSSTSELDSYHQYVRPRLELQRTIETQQRQLLRQKEEQQVLKKEVQGMQIQNSGTLTQTGKSASFRYYSHFYQDKKKR